MKHQVQGFSLIELLIALAISGLLMSGISLVYVALSQSINSSKELENAQEVLRYSSEVFTRSLKQTVIAPLVPDASTLVVQQTTDGATACNGTKPAVPFTETFSLNGNQLLCQVTGLPNQTLLTGIADIRYLLNGNLVAVTVTPENLNVAALANGFRIDVALSGKIMNEALN